MKAIRLSVRYKIVLVIAGVLLMAMGTYLSLAATLFTRDKLAYIYDLNASLVTTLSEQTRSNLSVLIKELSLFVREARVDKAAARDFLSSEPDLLRVQTYERRGADWLLQETFTNRETMALLQLHDSDLPLLHKDHPVPLQTIGDNRDEVFVQNVSLPPEAAILTLGFRGVDNTLVVADFRHDRLLRIFGRSKLHLTYLVDERGAVVAHPNGELVLKHADLSQQPLVQSALSSGALAGVKEFVDSDKTDQIGAFGRVQIGRLTVLTQISKEEALRASRELVTRSALFAIAILLAAFIVSIFFSRLLTAPLLRLRQAAESIGQGQFDVRVEVTANDEIGDLANTFRAMARALKETQAQLVQSEKMAAFGQLGAGITHEVKNPLTSIIGFTQLAQRQVEDAAKTRASLQVVQQEAERCLKIVLNFLKFARSSTGELAPIQVNDVIEEVARVLEHQMSIHNVKLELTLAQDLPAISGNGAELQQVLLNLVINAQQAMPSGGRVALTTGRDARGQVTIAVQDTGPGIPENIRAKIFEPFFTTKPAGEGTGLGLSVSFSIIQAHKGSIDVDSQVGKGTTFTIRLPPA